MRAAVCRLVVEVSESTFDASDTTSNGGFRMPFGGGFVVIREAYVTVSMIDMTDRTAATVISESQISGTHVKFYPFDQSIKPGGILFYGCGLTPKARL